MLTKNERVAMRDLCEALPYPTGADDTELRLLDHADEMDELIAGLVGALREADHRVRILDSALDGGPRTEESRAETRRVVTLIADILDDPRLDSLNEAAAEEEQQ